MLLMYDEPGAYDAVSESERRALLAEYRRLSSDLVAEGAFVDANPLERTRHARTLRVADGSPVVREGPVLEEPTLGGYYVIDVASMDEALAWAARLPAARFGPVEVRAVEAA